MIPSCDHTGTPRIPFDGFRHFTSSTASGSACLMIARIRDSMSLRQSSFMVVLFRPEGPILSAQANGLGTRLRIVSQSKFEDSGTERIAHPLPPALRGERGRGEG